MKKILFVTFFLCVALNLFSQKSLTDIDLKARLLETSNKQKIGACMLFVIGGAVLAHGITIFNEPGSLDDAVSGLGVAILGGACVLSSLPLYYQGSRNKRKALSISIKHQNTHVPLKVNIMPGLQTSLVLKFQIGK